MKRFTRRPGRGEGPPRSRLARISESTVRRLSHYYRVLEEVEAEGKRLISSHRLAEREGITSAQVRKDLSCFGSFGRRGLGYNVAHLRDEIRAILGLDRRWRVAGHHRLSAEVLDDEETLLQVGVQDVRRRQSNLAQSLCDGDKRRHALGEMRTSTLG